jgi:hypothetical protein
MTQFKTSRPSPDWRAIFEKRPDLKPPGFEETVNLIKQLKEEQSNGQVKP